LIEQSLSLSFSLVGVAFIASAARHAVPDCARHLHTKENMTFAEIGLHPAILKALTDSGYSEPTPVQQQAIPAALPAAT
jgi:superfamily II DNA/RNA helicase